MRPVRGRSTQTATTAAPAGPEPAAATAGDQPPGVADSGQAWLIAAAGLLANAACWGTMNSFGAFLDSMKTEFDASLGATALIYALPSLVLFVLGMVTGPLAEQYGPRRMVATGAALIGTGLLVTAHAPNLPVAVLAYGLGVGLGMACFLVPITACIGGWFVRRRALAQGLSAAGSGVGTLTMVPLARWLIDAYGWRRAYEVLAVICVTALLATAAVAARPLNRRPAGRPSLRRLREAAAHGPFLQAYAGGFLLSASLFVPFVFLVRYATDHGIAKRDAALLLSILGASNIVSRLLTTAVASRTGAVRPYLLCFVSLPVGLGLWLAAGSSYAALGVFAAVLGISHGGYVALSPEVTAELFGAENIGVVLGALWTSAGVGGFLSPVLAGMLIDAAGYTTTIAVALGVGVLAVVVQPALWSFDRTRRAPIPPARAA